MPTCCIEDENILLIRAMRDSNVNDLDHFAFAEAVPAGSQFPKLLVD